VTIAGRPTFRRRLATDTPEAWRLFRHSLVDYLRRTGQIDATADWTSPAAIVENQALRAPWIEHLAATAAEDWVAEGPDGRVIGWAQSIERDGMLELTMFFVDPEVQSTGVGRGLLERAFPLGRGHTRTICATQDPRAVALYLRFGVRFAASTIDFLGRPQRSDVLTDLVIERVEPGGRAEAEASIMAVERALLGHARREDTRFLLAERPAWLARRDHRVVGMAFGIAGDACGPIGVLDPGDLPALMATVESDAAGRDVPELGFSVPMSNSTAIGYALARGYKVDTWFGFILSSSDRMQLDRYVMTQPNYIL
jgi:GNAT superfamily N-acetyltransferase